MKDSHVESKVRLEHIFKAIDDIEIFVQNKSLETFCRDSILSNTVYSYSIVGEAINRHKE